MHPPTEQSMKTLHVTAGSLCTSYKHIPSYRHIVLFPSAGSINFVHVSAEFKLFVQNNVTVSYLFQGASLSYVNQQEP
jgi:hypothetical protein